MEDKIKDAIEELVRGIGTTTENQSRQSLDRSHTVLNLANALLVLKEYNK